jgi:tRNA threonylcarbamoyladenosine biosynthesis protein TsaB
MIGGPNDDRAGAPKMIVLGFDTATTSTAVGLMLSDGRLLEGRDDPSAGERPGHSTRLLPLAHGLLEQAQLRWEEIERIAVGVGPGTFTGLRIGVSTARGLAQSLAVDLVGVSSLRALAHPFGNRDERVLAVIDARRGEAFAAAYQGGEGLSQGGEGLSRARALPPEGLAEVLEQGAGIEHSIIERSIKWTAVGDGALRFADILLGLGVNVLPSDSPLHAISGRSICELGAGATPQGTALVPDYGRLPDAEVALQGAGSSSQGVRSSSQGAGSSFQGAGI